MLLIKIILSFACMAAALSSSHATYFRGTDVSASKNSPYSILTLNACMMDRDLPTRYGGMTPADERIDRLADFILREDPDIFLGQEIMSNAGQKLYERLKDKYAHFWIGIGKIPGKEESGLFVASKKPILQEPQFVPFLDQDQVDKKYFPNQTRFLERGFFYFDLGGFFIVTSHLEGGSEQYGAPLHRIHQLQLITNTMDLLDKPYIVTGDLNLLRTGQPNDEYSRSNISRDYYDFYTLHHPDIDDSTYTCTNYFTAVANGNPLPTEEEKNEIDDYFLIRNPFQNQFANLNIVLVSDTYDTDQSREMAITDHKAYKATFQFAPHSEN
jgi:hypothetical protein